MRTDFGQQIIVIVYVFDWVRIECGERVQIRSLPGAVPD